MISDLDPLRGEEGSKQAEIQFLIVVRVNVFIESSVSLILRLSISLYLCIPASPVYLSQT